MDLIKHKGIIKEVRNGSLQVMIVNESACASCHAKGACTVSDFQEKEIEITAYTKSYIPGQQITILFKESNGFKAVFLGYILPFLVVFITLVISLEVTGKEGLSGILSLIILIPYYIILHFFRNQLKKIFKFEIEEIN